MRVVSFMIDVQPEKKKPLIYLTPFLEKSQLHKIISLIIRIFFLSLWIVNYVCNYSFVLQFFFSVVLSRK